MCIRDRLKGGKRNRPRWSGSKSATKVRRGICKTFFDAGEKGALGKTVARSVVGPLGDTTVQAQSSVESGQLQRSALNSITC